MNFRELTQEFIRTKKQGPTSFLYAANTKLLSSEKLLNLFYENGAIAHSILPECSHFEFKDVTSASDFLFKYKDSVIDSLGRKLFLDFTQPKIEKKLAKIGDEIEDPSVTKNVLIEGLVIIENFITEDEENDLLNSIDHQEWITPIKRRVQHYGYAFNYDINNIDVNKPLGTLPTFVAPFLDRMVKKYDLPSIPDQLTINEYLPGFGIKPHVDTHSAFEDGLYVISISSACTMLFQNGKIHKNVHVPRRSLMILTGEARYQWNHCIWYRKYDKNENELVERNRRVSLTFRKVLKGSNCSCKWPEKCDTYQKKEMTVYSGMTTELERENVIKVYDAIAEHWDHTRHHPWPKVADFLLSLPKGTLVADVGCGNGKYFTTNPELNIIGFDRSVKLVEICHDKYPQVPVLVCDALKIPFRKDSFECVISIALLHHFSTIENRIQALREMLRIAKKDALILVCAWAYEQDQDSRFKLGDKQDHLMEWKLQKKFNQGEEETFQRYCHFYKKGEIEHLLLSLSDYGVKIIESTLDHSNWFILMRKN